MSRKHRSRRPFLSPLREEEQLAPADPSRRTKRMAAAAAFCLAVLLAGVLLLRTRAQSSSPSYPQLFTYTSVNEYPHDPTAFTQGLEYDKNGTLEFFWESTGMYGQSTVRQVELATGNVLRSKALGPQDFGEGITRFGDKLYQEIWQHGTLYSYAVDDFDIAQTLKGPLQDGWGITTDGKSLILSDGSADLSFVDPDTLAVTRTLPVTDGAFAVHAMNELEWVAGEVWANIWQTDCIARIDPSTGTVKGWIMLGALHTALRAENIAQSTQMDVLNGIAYDAMTGRLWVTGKYWPRLFEIKVQLQAANPNALQLLAARQQCIKSNSGF